MYLSDRDLRAALDEGSLIVEPRPRRIDPSSIDVHLGEIDSAMVWDREKWEADERERGHDPALHLGSFDYRKFGRRFLRHPPEYDRDSSALVMRQGQEIVVRPGGFVLWMTRERIGTPETNPKFLCFVDGKSTKARTGIVVHLTAPTIHAGWSGNVVLEIKNLGDLSFRLCPGDAIAQITVATVSSPPVINHSTAGSATLGQTTASGD